MLKEVTVYTLFGSICYCYGAICNLPRNTYPHYDYDNDLHISMSPVLLVSNLFLVMITLTCVYMLILVWIPSTLSTLIACTCTWLLLPTVYEPLHQCNS